MKIDSSVFKRARLKGRATMIRFDSDASFTAGPMEMSSNWVTEIVGPEHLGVVSLKALFGLPGDVFNEVARETFFDIVRNGLEQTHRVDIDPVEPGGERVVALDAPVIWRFLGTTKSQLRSRKFMVTSLPPEHVEMLRGVAAGDAGALLAERRPNKYWSKFSLGWASMILDGMPELDFEIVPDMVDANGRVRTDGAALIGWKSAIEVRRALGLSERSRVAAFQARMPGLKFVAQVSPEFEHGLKIYASSRKFGPDSGRHKISVLNWSKRGPASLNYQVIQMADLPFSSLGWLVDDVWQRLVGGAHDRDRALMLLNLIGGGDDDEEAIDNLTEKVRLFKFVRDVGPPAMDPYILKAYLRHEQVMIERMKTGRIPVAGATVYAVPDVTGVLNPGEVYFNGHVGPVGLFRNPCTHSTSPRKVRAVNRPELSHLIDVLVMPTSGDRCEMHEMDGGDFDGDRVTVVTEPGIWFHMREIKRGFDWPAGHAVAPSLEPLSELQLAEFVFAQWSAGNIGMLDRKRVIRVDLFQHAGGRAADFGELDGLSLEQAISIDAASTGRIQASEPREDVCPHWLPAAVNDSVYISTSAIGKLFDLVTEKSAGMDLDIDRVMGDPQWIDQFLAVDGTGEPYMVNSDAQAWVKEIAMYYRSYNRAVFAAIERAGQDGAVDEELRRRAIAPVIEEYRGLRDSLSNGDPELARLQAAAAMFVVYSGRYRSRAAAADGKWSLSFPWAIWTDDLLDIMRDPDLARARRVRMKHGIVAAQAEGDGMVIDGVVLDSSYNEIGRIASRHTDGIALEAIDGELVAKLPAARVIREAPRPLAPEKFWKLVTLIGTSRMGLDPELVIEAIREHGVLFDNFSERAGRRTISGMGAFLHLDDGDLRIGKLSDDTPAASFAQLRGRLARVTSADIFGASIHLRVEIDSREA